MARRVKYRTVDYSVGWLVLITALLIGAAAVQTGRVQEWLRPGVRFDVLMPVGGTEGLKQGAEVTMLGASAGHVTDVTIDENGDVIASVQVDRDFARFIAQDSLIYVRRAFVFAGDASLEITVGRGSPLVFDETTTLEARIDTGATDAVASILDEVKAELGPLMNNAERSSASVATILESIAEGKGPAGRALMNEPMADEIDSIVFDLGKISRGLSEIASNINEASGELTRSAQDTAAVAPGLILQIEQTLAEVEALSRAMQSNWLIGGNGELPEDPELPSPSESLP